MKIENLIRNISEIFGGEQVRWVITCFMLLIVFTQYILPSPPTFFSYLVGSIFSLFLISILVNNYFKEFDKDEKIQSRK